MDPISLKINPLLREAAELKIEELCQAKYTFKHRYLNKNKRSGKPDVLDRLSTLLNDIKTLDPYLEDENELCTIACYVEQAKDDQSISETKLLKFEQQLQEKIHDYVNRLEVSALHAELLREAMADEKTANGVAARSEVDDFDDDFEVVEDTLKGVFEKFEEQITNVKDVDVDTLEQYLSTLMELKGDTKALEELRNSTKKFGNELIDEGIEVEQDELMWWILDLLKNDLISDGKRKTLESYLLSPIVIRELVSTLRLKSVRSWNWKNPEKGLLCGARPNSDGGYDMVIDEDMIDMLFLHAIAMSWATKLKENLGNFFRTSKWTFARRPTDEESNRRIFFLENVPFEPTSPTHRPMRCDYRLPPPPPPPPFYPPHVPHLPPKKGRKSRHRNVSVPVYTPVSALPPPPPPLPLQAPPPPPIDINLIDSVDNERQNTYMRDFFTSRLPSQEGCTPKVMRPEAVQASLIKTLAVEVKLREAFDGEVHIFCTEFISPAYTLSHKAVLAVLKFIGVSDLFLDFFTRFLQAKLRSSPDRVSTRAVGVPVGHGMELLFTEVIFFFLELAVYKKTGLFLYRLQNKCYFVGTAAQVHDVGNEMADFSSAMGVEFVHLQEPLSIGHLVLTSQPSATSTFQISVTKVEAYAQYMKQKLAACSTVLEWIRVWNNTVGTYAAHLCGPLASVFGNKHVAAVTAAYKRMFSIIFDGSNLTDYMKTMLHTHVSLPLDDPPFALEALLYLPHAYGGLGIKNPFVTLNLARDLCADPDAEVTAYLASEAAYLGAAEARFASYSPMQRQHRAASAFASDTIRRAALGPDSDMLCLNGSFMSKAEFAHLREYAHLAEVSVYSRLRYNSLAETYRTLLAQPVEAISPSSRVRDELRRLAGRGDMKTVARLGAEELWVLQLYAAECFERYGGLEAWCPDSVPMEAMKGVRGVMWDGDDDDSSYISYDP